MFSSLTGIFYSIKRQFIPDDSHSYIICSNHTSYLDIVFMHVSVPLNIVFVGKKELTRMPFVRVFFREMHIAIDRGSTTDAHRGMSRASDEFDAGRSPVIFPENGAFKLAIEKQADIIPVTFVNNYRLLDTNHFLYGIGRPGISRVVVHPPVSTKGMQATQVEELKQKVYDIIASALPKTTQIKQHDTD
jgi:1-acyl-sn-glycerol-3-phosphate acyltransferase